jgi:hypothetical protein
MRLLHGVLAIIAVAGGAGCGLFESEPRACGQDPALIVWATGSERAREGEYLLLLEALEADSSLTTWLRWYSRRFPWDGITYFSPGEPLHVLRGGDLSDRTVLVGRHGERLWTTWRESRC